MRTKKDICNLRPLTLGKEKKKKKEEESRRKKKPHGKI